MPRRPTKPTYFPNRGAYYVQIKGAKHPLAVGPEDDQAVKDEAWKNFHALMAREQLVTDGDRATVYSVLEQFLEYVSVHKAANTYDQRVKFLKPFSERYGTLRVCDLKKHHVEEWLTAKARGRNDDPHRGWGASTRRCAIASVTAAFRWAVDQGLISRNPLPPFKRPAEVSRGAYCVVTEGHHRLLLEREARRRHKGFYYLLLALHETGARPGEVCGVEARHFREDVGGGPAWVIEATADDEGRNKQPIRGGAASST
jgi:integrase